MATSSSLAPAPTAPSHALSRTASAEAEAGTASFSGSSWGLDGPTRVGSRAASPDSLANEKPAPAPAAADVDLDEEKAEADAAGESPIPTVLTFPDGGRDAWRTVAGATLLIFNTFGLSNIGGVFVSEYSTNQLATYPLSDIAWITSTHLFLTFSSSFLAGWLFDHGYFRHQLVVGSCLWILGIFSLSASTTFTQIFLSHAVCLGLGVGIMFGPCLSAVGLYFGKKRGLVLGCVTAGAGLGAMFFDILLNKLFPVIGYAASVRVAGYIMTALLIVSNLLIKPRIFPAKVHEPVRPLLTIIVREPEAWLVCGGCLFTMLGLFIPLIYIQVYATSHGCDATLARYSIAVVNAAACVARVCSGLVADKIGRMNATIPFALLVSVMCFAMLGATSTASTAVFLIIFGCASGGFIALSPGLFIMLAKTVAQVGVRSGVGFCFIGLAALVSSPIAGVLLSAANGSYVAPCCFGGACALVGAGMLFMGRQVIARQTEGWKI